MIKREEKVIKAEIKEEFRHGRRRRRLEEDGRLG